MGMRKGESLDEYKVSLTLLVVLSVSSFALFCHKSGLFKYSTCTLSHAHKGGKLTKHSHIQTLKLAHE